MTVTLMIFDTFSLFVFWFINIQATSESWLISKPMDSVPVSFPMEWPSMQMVSCMWPPGEDRRSWRSIQRKSTFLPTARCLWFTIFCFSVCLFICSSGQVELEIKFPAEQVTSAAFGGPNLDILFVTTAAQERSGPQPKPAGQLFKVTGLGAKGLAGVKVRV